MVLHENERIDYVNDALSLIQKTKGLTFGTDALLLAGYINGKHRKAAELGGGSGIISMLLLTRGKCASCYCYEVQPEYAELIRRNAELNNLSDSLFEICTDVRDVTAREEYDLVFSNPPYMKATSGALNENDAKTVARHEINGDIGDFVCAAARMLKYGGTLAVVYRPDRICDLIFEMRRAGVEPKRLTLVHSDVESKPSMLLVEGKKGGKCGLMLTRPLIIYENKEHLTYSADMNYIMENGSFPSYYKK